MSRLFVSAERTSLARLAPPPPPPAPSSGRPTSSTPTQQPLSLASTDVPLSGYQIYTNTDWVVNRERLFKTFAVYTGRPDHVALVSVAEFGGAGEDERIRRAFAAFEKDNLKMVDTGIGVMMIGNPEWFSKASSPCIAVPGGDYDRYLPDLLVNINLRRFGCGERSLLSYRSPSQAVIDKFYRVTGIEPSSDITLSQCVLGLGQLVHQALTTLNLLNREFGDGLMCDATQAALQSFYNEFGPFDDVDMPFSPPQGSGSANWCDPTLLAVVLRTVEHLKHKLGVLGHAVKPGAGADTNAALPRAIKHFQKAHGLKVSMVFDRRTIDKIEALYLRSQTQVQAVAAVSSTVNVLRSKIEDMTGLPTASRRSDDPDRDGVGLHLSSHAQSAAAIDHQDLDSFFAAWVKKNKRLEKIQGKKKVPHGSSGTTGSHSIGPAAKPSTEPLQTLSSRLSGSGLAASQGSPGTASISHTPSHLGDVVTPQPVIVMATAPSTASLPITPSALLTQHHPNMTPSASLPQHHSARIVDPTDNDTENDPHGRFRAGTGRVLRGLKDSTSRTLGGIVGKSKLVTKGMKHLANAQTPLYHPGHPDIVKSARSSDDLSSPLTPPRDLNDDPDFLGSATESGAEDRDTFPTTDIISYHNASSANLDPVKSAPSAVYSSTTSSGGSKPSSLIPPVPLTRGRTPPPSFPDTSTAPTAKRNVRRASADSAQRYRSDMSPSPLSAYFANNPRPTSPSPRLSSSGITPTTPQHQAASSTTSSVNPATPSSPPKPFPFGPSGQTPTSATTSTATSQQPTQHPQLSEESAPPPPLHPHLLPLIATLTRRIEHLTGAFQHHIPPLTSTLAQQTTTLASLLDEHAKRLDGAETAVNAVVARSRILEDAIEKAENEAMRTRYAVGVAHDRVAEAEDAVLGLMGRVRAVETWGNKKGGRGTH
ncbi:hypothetical protein PhCBS80983_g00667 [Powellomyces hirtus]|uniref:STB6-like N-terminal domain-containing protein n=1 Tax=Powellomyces hirtus TaxID=109895 RepID=A0A507EEC1_9FUNG|nr:hypothetical protein PhCBS80983_g00667 [Powellomyces hirtus]